MKKTLLLLCWAAPLLAAPPNRITYQGRLTQSGLAASGSYNFHACFGPGGTSPCTFPKTLTLPPSGDFTFVIDVPSGVDFLNNAVQLSIFVDGNPFSPADDLVSVPYALVTGTAAVALSASVAFSAQALSGNINASQVQLNGTGAFLDSWQSTTTPTMIDANDVLGLPWVRGPGGVLSFTGGNVGVGTTTPDSPLDVNGPLEVGTGARGAILRSSVGDNFQLHTFTNTPNPNFHIGYGDGAGGLDTAREHIFANAGRISMLNARVGIGTSAPGYALDVLHDDGSVGWAAKFQSVNAVNDGAVLLGSRFDNSGAIQSINSAGAVQNLLVNPDGGNVGVGTMSPAEKLDLQGNLRVSGSIVSESNKPSFFLSVVADDCGWSHPYVGCPAGYVEAGRVHAGGGCDGLPRGVGYENGTISSGWMGLCVAQ